MSWESDLADAGVRWKQLRPNVAASLQFICEHYAEPVTLEQIVAPSGLSTRGLQLAFKRDLGVGPKRVLTAVRLMHARRLLLLPANRRHGRVTVVARAVGMNHLGRFSAAYREQHGELPEQTQGYGVINA